MKKCVLTALGAVLGLALPLADVHAFWSRANYPIHQNMTKAALGKAGLYAFNGATPGFSTPAIDAITTQNHDQDNSNNYDASDHFDSETLSVSFDELKTTRMQLRSLLTGPTFDQPTIWKLMGRMLHQVQDFYSHSTWDKTQSKIINFGALTSLSPPVSAAVPTTSPLSTEFCAPDLKTLTYTGSALTTGYYPPRAPPAGKCTHGDLSFFAKVGSGVACALALSSSTAAPDGISRDHPCFSNTAANDDYTKAYILAESETEAFVKSITDELVLGKNGPGYCALLGVDPNNPICVAGLQILPATPSVAVGSTITLTVSATDATGNPGPAPPNLGWSSSDTTIATVIGGVVTGVALGASNITVTDPVSGAAASVTVMVSPVTRATYVYTGPSLTQCPAPIVSTGAPGAISVVVTFDPPIAADLTGGGQIASLTISSSGIGNYTLDQVQAEYSANIGFTNGTITSWSIIYHNVTGPPDQPFLETTNGVITVGSISNITDYAYHQQYDGTTYSGPCGTSTVLGLWTAE